MKTTTPAADAILDTQYPVLDHGWVSLVDYMGGDESIVAAARVSYDGRGKSDTRRLIRYLMAHQHSGPFEMCELKFRVQAPIFVARQWMRTRTASINEVSGRYTELPMEFYTPVTLRAQSAVNKQGSDGELDESITQAIAADISEMRRSIAGMYKLQLKYGVARELARIDLPLSTYTRWEWKIDLRNLLHFLELRLAPDAQEEIRMYAEKLAAIVRLVAPLSWEAFEDHVLYSTRAPWDGVTPKREYAL